MKTNILLAGLALGVGLLSTGNRSAQAAVVYANQAPNSADYVARFNPGSVAGLGNQVGDQIKLGGPVTGAPGADHAKLTSAQFDVWASGYTGNPTINAQVRFYANDGPLIGATHTPGTLLWDSTLFPITIQTAGGGSVPNAADVTLYNILFTTDVAGVVVPKDFTWSIQFSNLGGGNAGPLMWSPPSVGGNYTDYWLNTGGVWGLYGNTPPPNWDFAASFEGTAVPEPAPMLTMACVLGLGGLVAWRSRSKARVAA